MLFISVSCGLGGKRALGGLSAEIPVELHVSEASPKGIALALYCSVVKSEVNALGSVVSLVCLCLSSSSLCMVYVVTSRSTKN